VSTEVQRERERLQEVVVLQRTDPNLSVNYVYTFFALDYPWRPSRWSLPALTNTWKRRPYKGIARQTIIMQLYFRHTNLSVGRNGSVILKLVGVA